MSAVTLPVVHRRPAAKRKPRYREDLCFVRFETGNSTGALAIHCQVLTSQVAGSYPDRDCPVIGQQAAARRPARPREVRKVNITSLSVSARYFAGVTARPVSTSCSGPSGPGLPASSLPASSWRRPRAARRRLVPGSRGTRRCRPDRRDGRRDRAASARPRAGRRRPAASDVQRAAEIYRHVSVLPCNPISGIRDFLLDRPAADPGSPEAIRSHFAKPFNRVLTQFALGIFGLLSGPLAARPAAGRAVLGTRATRRTAQQHHRRRLG